MDLADDWNLEIAREVAVRAAAEVSLPGEDITLIRMAKNAVFVLPGADVVIRVCRPGHSDRDAAAFGEAARALGLPVLAPISGASPVEVHGHDVTFWPHCSPAGDQIDWEWFGAAIRQLHDRAAELGRILDRLPDLLAAQLESLRGRLATTDQEVGALEDRLAEIEHAVGSTAWPAPVVLHGDAHPANVLMTSSGEPVLSDFDHVAVGPAMWDHVPVDVETRHFGRPAEHASRMRAGYGADPRHEPGYDVLIELRELKVATWLAGVAEPTPVALAELRRRVAFWRGDASGRWTFA